MDRIPLYARGGAVIPMWPDAPASTAGYHTSVIELHLFVPEHEGTYTSFLQEDDGLSFWALQGARYRTEFELVRAGRQVSVRAEVTGDGYPEFAREAFHLVVHGAAPQAIELDGARISPRGQRFVLRNAGSGFNLRFELR
jgi:alpha-glucosidase